MTSDAKRRANAKYDAENTVQYAIKLNRTTDAELIEKLGLVKNRQGYIKQLIREDLRRERLKAISTNNGEGD